MNLRVANIIEEERYSGPQARIAFVAVSLKAYDTTKEARTNIGGWIRFYNHERTHQSLNRQTPEQVYLTSRSKELIA